ncbi:MAG: anthranilate phosphoribosyltransferase, partial [Bacteroidia bacterium]|nr:anthranilate phosphoribosyltransferase [Bacteroidia bacterium]
MKQVLQKLLEHETLSKDEAIEIIFKISEGKINNSQLAAFMTVFMMRPVTVDELTGFRDALMELCVKISFDEETIDVCGTGGDGKNTFNISTLSAFVVAGAGVKVAKHGNYGASSVSGSSNVLEFFGYKFSNDQSVLKTQLEKNNLCFMHAPFFHPALKHVGPVRKELGLKTFFNMLGPLVNPANPKNRMIGVYSRELARTYNYILQPSAFNYAIVNSDDGYDEISLTSDFSLFSHNGEARKSPAMFAKEKIVQKDIFGGETIEDAAKIFKIIL